MKKEDVTIKDIADQFKIVMRGLDKEEREINDLKEEFRRRKILVA